MIARPAQWLTPVLLLAACASAQPRAAQGVTRMQIELERLGDSGWHTVDPALVFAEGDRVRFRFHADFDGFLYVMNQSSSGHYEQLFPRDEAVPKNQVAAGKTYQVPPAENVFRIAGPPGFETVYWVVFPGGAGHLPTRPALPAGTAPPFTLLPRCDDTVLQARGQCVDHSAGPKLVPRGETVPDNLAAAAAKSPRDLLFLRQNDAAVIASTEPLTGPLVYQFRLAHK